MNIKPPFTNETSVPPLCHAESLPVLNALSVRLAAGRQLHMDWATLTFPQESLGTDFRCHRFGRKKDAVRSEVDLEPLLSFEHGTKLQAPGRLRRVVFLVVANFKQEGPAVDSCRLIRRHSSQLESIHTVSQMFMVSCLCVATNQPSLKLVEVGRIDACLAEIKLPFGPKYSTRPRVEL